MIRPILAYGNPLLRQKSFKVDIDNEDVSDLIFDMWETMYNANGVGLAAPQIGILKQIFIADFEHFKEEDSFNISEIQKLQQVFINPIIIDEFDEDFKFSEGCFSIPEISEEVIRKKKLTIEFVDEKFNLILKSQGGRFPPILLKLTALDLNELSLSAGEEL